MLDKTLSSLVLRGFFDITVIDNDSATPFETMEVISGKDTGAFLSKDHLEMGIEVKIIQADNSARQLAPWLLDLVPDDSYYIVMDCDNELVCPPDVEQVMIDALERYPQIEKLGLGIKTDDLLFPPPQHYAYSYLMEYSVERGTRYQTIGWAGHYEQACEVIDAPIDTTFAMYRPGHGWPGIVGARLTAPYHIRHLSWYNETYTEEERLYYERAGRAWTLGHSAGSLLDTTVAVPFTNLRAETVVGLAGEEVRYAPMLSDLSYWELLRDLWADHRSFIIIEHDIVVNETTLDELRICEHDWCAMPFPYRGQTHAYSLACTKFSGALTSRHPDLMVVVAEMWDEKHPRGHWCRLDAWMWEQLTLRGEKRHNHERAQPVGHVGTQYPSHGCLDA